jgi:predicted small metal-binding protein
MTLSPEHNPRMTDEPMRVRCACGWEATGTEDEVVAATSEHGERVHNMRATRDEILAMAIPADVPEAR